MSRSPTETKRTISSEPMANNNVCSTAVHISFVCSLRASNKYFDIQYKGLVITKMSLPGPDRDMN